MLPVQADKGTVCRLLRTARGQIDGILRMIEEDRYCMEIANQLMATESVLNKANREILRAHLEGCVKSAIEQGDAQEKIQEIEGVLDKLLK